MKSAGAGRDAAEVSAPAVLPVSGKGRVLVFGFGAQTSGIPRDWAAGERAPGVRLLPDLSARTVAQIADRVCALKRPGDLALASIHWGGNWGYQITAAEREFAHALIDQAGVDLIHGHSSHHPKAIEIYRDKLILYGCGDFLNDYEGIAGYEQYRGDLVLMYLAPGRSGGSAGRAAPDQIRQFRLSLPAAADTAWLREVLDRESRRFGTRVAPNPDATLSITWR